MIEQLHKQIAAAGIPIDGVAKTTDGVRIDFRNAAAEHQRQQARAIAKAFDWTPPTPRPRAAILADLDGLDAVGLSRLVTALLADRILAEPCWAIEQGINIPGDEIS